MSGLNIYSTYYKCMFLEKEIAECLKLYLEWCEVSQREPIVKELKEITVLNVDRVLTVAEEVMGEVVFQSKFLGGGYGVE